MIKIFNDHQDSSLLEFRKKVIFNDCKGFPADCLINEYNYNDLKKIVNNESFEDGFRYTKRKFNSTPFHHMLGLELNNEICTFSGAVQHGNHMKFAIYHYLLNSYRLDEQARGILYKKNGFIDKHREIANNLNLDSLFFTIFEHNRKLQWYVKNLLNKKRHKEKYDMQNLSLVEYGGKIIYNDVEQHLFYIKLKDNFDVRDLINVL